jgi:Zinc finger, C3HC4 type (RING finger)
MKFGKNILEQQVAAPNHRFLDYKVLKKLVTSDAFIPALDKELDECNASYNQSVSDCRALFDRVSECEPGRLESLTRASTSLEALRRCAMWNAIAVIKILKKRAKLGAPVEGDAQAWLKRQSFFACEDFAELKVIEASLTDLVMNRHSPVVISDENCPICLETCVDPVQLACNHRFCWKCFVLGPVTSGEYRIDRCPVCRSEQALDPSVNFIVRPPVMTMRLLSFFPLIGSLGTSVSAQRVSRVALAHASTADTGVTFAHLLRC